jgi:hypothetical protein
MTFRKFHINEFPQDRVFVYLKEDFHQQLFSSIRKYKFKDFNKIYFENRLNWSTFKQWKKRNTDLKIRIKQHFLPLWFIIKLSQIFPEYSINVFEKNIVAMKGPSSSKIILNPNLPLLEDERLMKIIAHFLADGHVSGAFGTGLPKGKSHSEYRNFDKGLLNKFEKDMGLFGTIKLSKDYDHGHVIVPNLIGYILTYLYGIKFDCFNSRVPKRLFYLPRKLISAFLRAFGDDEGYVYDSSIEYYSNNNALLNDILILINFKFPEIKTSNIKMNTKAGKNTKYSFKIYHCSQYKYLNLIGFDHQQKERDLLFNLKRKGKNYKINKKVILLGKLSNHSSTAKQLSRELRIRHSTILEYLNYYKKIGFVYVSKKEGWSYIWSLRN